MSVTADTCTTDDTLVCATGAVGESCTGSATPDTSSQVCSEGIVGAGLNGGTGYCCFPFVSSASTCSPDSTVNGCAGGSFGFSCAGSDTPDQTDATLVCSTGVAGNAGSTLFCCTNGTVVVTDTCSPDSTLSCAGNAMGESCTGALTPDTSSQVCSEGTPGAGVGGATGFCCVAFTSTTCSPDATVNGCQGTSYGFSCTGSDTPDAADPSLTCSTGVAGNAGSTLFCCTN